MPSNDPALRTGALLRDSSWTINRRVIGALLLREMLTRYGRNNIGFLWLFVEPMLFTLVITIFWSATRTIHGSNIPIVAFALTGYSSLLMWRNMPGRCAGALKSTRPNFFFLNYLWGLQIDGCRSRCYFLPTNSLRRSVTGQ